MVLPRGDCYARQIAAFSENPTLVDLCRGDGIPIALLAISSLLLGVALAKFRVLILLPAISLGAICTIVIGVAQGSDVWPITAAIVLYATVLQLGYLASSATPLRLR
jgi:hypothetical protein